MSRLKHATQMPMFLGLPSLTKMGAKTPTAIPVKIIPLRDEKKPPNADIFKLLSFLKCQPASEL
jgi:hypothetical protein